MKLRNALKELYDQPEKHPQYGIPRSEETREKLRHCAYEQFYNSLDHMTYDEYVQTRVEYKEYFRSVWNITRRVDTSILEHSDKRALADVDGAYHLDHIFPISMGFAYNIPPKYIGDIRNMRFIPARENIQKGNNIIDIPLFIKEFLTKNNIEVNR